MELLHVDIGAFIIAAGYIGLVLMVFFESALLGFFLPGDSVIFSAGFLAATTATFNIWILMLVVSLAAILGDNLGYWIGQKLGPRLFTRRDSLIFNKKYIVKTHQYYEKYGPQTLILARFIPVARSFAPMLAGVGQMPYSKFLRYNAAGALLWGAGSAALGYWAGVAIPHAQTYFFPIVLGVMIVSCIPFIVELIRYSVYKKI